MDVSFVLFHAKYLGWRANRPFRLKSYASFVNVALTRTKRRTDEISCGTKALFLGVLTATPMTGRNSRRRPWVI
jgi:hypothetical protein